MSGILAAWNSQQQTPWQTMLDDLTILGTDGKGDWHDRQAQISLGRTQFFNTPESCLETPVVEAEGCVLVWDGRLDDRAAILAGRSLVTDAQLILESYRRWGEEFQRYLIGEFVFILWDTVQDVLIAGCDKVGGRTICYYWDGQTLLLSSRSLSLLHHPCVSSQLDDLYLAHTLCDLQAHPPEITPFADIKRLLPGAALVVKRGHLQHRRIARLEPLDRDLSPKFAEQHYEQFWHLLNCAVRDRLRNCRSVCTTLSGGLDSTTIAVSLLNQLPAIDAFSAITTVFPEFDERQSIQSFLQRYPQIHWHAVNCDDAWTFSDPWDTVPFLDDPLMMCNSAMQLRLMKQMQQNGFGLMFTGDWGDELCYSSLKEQAGVNNWRQVFHYFMTYGNWKSTLWNQFVLPSLPEAWQLLWFKRCQRRYNPIPPWITSAYANQSEVQTALKQYFKLQLIDGQVASLNSNIEGALFPGDTQNYKFLLAAHGIESTSPFQDQRLTEFAFRIHPSLQSNSQHDKLFFREANRTTLPDDVRLRPKNNYFDPLKYAGIGRGEIVLMLLEKIKSSPILQRRIDFKELEECLFHYRNGYVKNYSPGTPFENNSANHFFSFFAFTNWYLRLLDGYKKTHISFNL
ncbi:MAG: asparagine synthase [Myxacorys californica WJT36-NPBG1]|jgi:asparagine synthase (glutamine-hydrolysing)|nr:asparagine synthase [Myxacorys californica WJT36-NPBG1]